MNEISEDGPIFRTLIAMAETRLAHAARFKTTPPPDHMRVIKMFINGETWRVQAFSNGAFSVMYIGLGEHGEEVKHMRYGNESLLPEWIRGRLAVLNMIKERPPTAPIEGIGRRITDVVYWLDGDEQ